MNITINTPQVIINNVDTEGLILKIEESRKEFMAAFDDLQATAKAERAEVQAKLKDLSDKLDKLTGETLTPEQVKQLQSDIANISEPDSSGPPGPGA